MKKIRITSRNNSQIKKLLADEDKNMMSVFEGEKLVFDILKRQINLEILIVDYNYFIINQLKIEKKSQNTREIWLVSQPVIKKLSKLKNPPPLMGAMKSLNKKKFLTKQYSTVLVLDNIQNPANCGGIFRSAAAFNIDCIVLTGSTVSLNNRKFLRGAQDSIFEIDYFLCSSLSEFLNTNGLTKYNIYSTSSKGNLNTVLPQAIKIPCLVIFGNEGAGLENQWLNKFDTVKIPQSKTINSLNLTVSTSLIAYEIFNKIKKYQKNVTDENIKLDKKQS